ncbi:SAM-dependent DNA methyltransferase [Enterobacter cloacae]|uniref:SAM-dependent DNA methyltransferase n=1 Tax=Enterobacter cloacae TaxID=550 RepID=UPI00325A62CC
MPGMINHEKAFVKLFSQTARYHHRFKVFEDFISCSVIALENRLHFSEVREQKYLRIVGGYEKEDVTRMAQLLAHVVNGLGEASGDFLGRVFMQLELGDKYRGQFFTPWDVARMIFADVLRKAGWPPHRYLWVSATDIDPLAAGMAYIQLSLCGIAGEVVAGNTLVNERRRILYTPGHYLGGWPVRLSSRHFQAA